MPNILLIEDDKIVREIISNLLELNGYSVYTANNGKQALVLIDKLEPDLVITDLMMPYVDGFELIDSINKNKYLKKIPIIILTGTTQHDELFKDKNLKFDLILKKPFRNNELLLNVENIIKKNRKEKNEIL